MDISNIKQIVELMKDNDLCEFELEDEGVRIAIKRGSGNAPQVIMSSMPSSPVVYAPPTLAGAPAAGETAPKAAGTNWVEIKSPIVGTFYRSASPDSEPFVSVGQTVTKETVVCIIEAMKVMNEIKAEVSGVIKKVLVENATPVQFGQAMFQVEPA